ncbi:hypothetical protein KIN20_032577 [Parelaphostrongylus tenuis]|uniref:G-protein coupled receptors family 1 profile domain-containing protein n=1 Tax=Parelaphostrongylus tenuis TaxID=148309 RepID=A0AAD5R7B9_PARTN|nr:hypothetical protein KIN20_032577 [Parelaphostrongylus tenuis]
MYASEIRTLHGMEFACATVNASDIIDFKDRISYRIVNTIIAMICVISNLILLFVFLGNRELRVKYVLLIQLAVADLIYSLSTTTAKCALDIGLQSKLIGDVLIAMTILWMGMERFIAITFPFFYRINVDRRYLKLIIVPIISMTIVMVVLLFGLLSVLNGSQTRTFNCGRKSTFGLAFSAFIYISCIVSNFASTLLNAISYVKARATMRNNPRQAQQHVDTIRYYLLISVLSAVLVSVPNFKSLYKVYAGKVLLGISKPSDWLQTLNAGINLFVYISFNKEFRQRILYLLRLGRESHQTSEG